MFIQRREAENGAEEILFFVSIIIVLSEMMLRAIGDHVKK